jgi:hypothetical protein
LARKVRKNKECKTAGAQKEKLVQQMNLQLVIGKNHNAKKHHKQ